MKYIFSAIFLLVMKNRSLLMLVMMLVMICMANMDSIGDFGNCPLNTGCPLNGGPLNRGLTVVYY